MLHDTQSQRDARGIPIDRVGVKSLRFPMRIRDRDKAEQHSVALVSLAVDLPHHFKGTHMSRFVEVLHSHGRVVTVADIAAMPRELMKKLDAEKAHVTFEFPWFRRKKAPATGAAGIMDYGVVFESNGEGRHVDFVVTVKVPVATLCPCSKAISARGAHNQRGVVTFSLRFSKPVWIEEMIDLVEQSASCELYSLLKRPDEKLVTERAYDNPVFVEDLVRNVALRAKQHPQITWFRVEAENFESIHNHNAYAVIEQSIKRRPKKTGKKPAASRKKR